MKQLLSGISTMVLYACAGTVIAFVIIFIYVTSAWNMDGTRWGQAIDVARGAVVIEESEEKEPVAEKTAEQPSYKQILEARALKFRNLELREQQLQNNLAQVQFEQAELVKSQKKFKHLQKTFDEQLLTMQNNTASAGVDDVRRIMESINSKQAKELILQMLENEEMDAVVALLSPMPDNKSKKIIGEFKTPEEIVKIGEVLRRIREGQPESQVAENAQEQLKKMEAGSP